MSIGFIILYPLLYMIITSITAPSSFANSTRVWIPTEFLIADNYQKAFVALDYVNSFLSTVNVCFKASTEPNLVKYVFDK